MDDWQLLNEYATRQSEEAFRSLVDRYVGMVYHAALRQVRNPHAAEEITQAVFIALAQKAGKISRNTLLYGWLFRATRYAVLNFVREETTRQRHEQEALTMQTSSESDDTGSVWDQIAPHLNDALELLSQTDREVVMIRFFGSKSHKDLAQVLGISEDTAKKRVSRAIERLRVIFARRGVVVPTIALAAAFTACGSQAAPIGLASSVAAMAVAKGAGTASTLTITKGILKIMAWTKVKTAVVGVVVAACLVTPILVQHQAQASMREGDDQLRHQGEQLAGLQAENDRLSDLAANASLTQNQLNDLQKLRQEVNPLRQQANAVAQLREENRRLKAKTGQDNPKSPIQIKEEAMARMDYSKHWMVGFYRYADKHDGQFPTNFEAAAGFIQDKVKNRTDVTTDQFEIVFQGSRSAIANPADTIVIREKEAWDTGGGSHSGQWAKIYTFADGHIEIHNEAENNFDAYEKQHMIPPAITQ